MIWVILNIFYLFLFKFIVLDLISVFIIWLLLKSLIFILDVCVVVRDVCLNSFSFVLDIVFFFV